MNTLLHIGALVAVLAITEQLYDDWNLPQYGWVGIPIFLFIMFLTVMALDFDVRDVRRWRRGNKDQQ